MVLKMKIKKLCLGNPQKTRKGLSARNRLQKSNCCTSSVDRAPRDHANVTNKVVVSLSYLATLVEGYIPRRCLEDALEELESTSNVPRTCRRSMTSARCRLAACPWAPRPPGRPPAGLAAPTCPLLPPPFTPRPIQASSTASDHGGGAWLEFQSDVHEVERQEKPPRHLFARSEHRSVVLELGVSPRAACSIFMNRDEQDNMT